MAQQLTQRKQQELQVQYTNYKNGLQQIAQKIGDVEQEAEEHTSVCSTAQFQASLLLHLILNHTAGMHAHRYFVHTELVLETLEPLPADRKCFRMINGVLVERTVKDVVPALKTNSEGLRKVLEDLVKQYNSKQVEMEKWKKKNNIQVVQQ